LKVRDVRFTIFSSVFLIAIIPVAILFLVISSETSKELQLRDKTYLSSFIKEKIEDIDNEFQRGIAQIDSTSSIILPAIIAKRSLTEETEALYMLTEKYESVRSLYLYDKDRKSLNRSSDDPYSTGVTEQFTEKVFSEPLTIDYISFPDNQSLLCLYKKHVSNGILIGYSAILIDFSLLQPHLHMPDNLNLDLFDEEYKLLATTTDKQLGVVTINDLTRRMVDGYSEIMAFDQNIHSFSFLNLGETSLYLTVYQKEKDFGRYSRGRFSLSFFVIILFFASYVTAWKLHKEVLRFGERILVRKSYSREMRFFSRLKSNLQNLSENVKIFEDIENQLKYMENDIEYIIENIPEPDDEKKG